jgi:hypothetical protein
MKITTVFWNVILYRLQTVLFPYSRLNMETEYGGKFHGYREMNVRDAGPA